ncbi:MAG TPA: ABC transporter substrate-binding protein/permease, partial [Minicystis sp.]|nr:ABC transporter substrate-binding protein/permease [Minicystis sp.]
WRRAAARLALAVAALALVVAGVPRAARADALDQVRARGELRWGGDQEGGGPYVYPKDDDPLTVTGFEVDLAAAIARRVGVRAAFVQAPWDKLPEMLRTGKVDVILNGYELTPEREDVMDPSIPYYRYALALLARRGDDRVARWDALPRAPGGRPLEIGVLTGSAAETYVRELCGGSCVVRSYDGNTDAMREVETGKLDATVQDTPIAAFYASRFPKLHEIGEPEHPGYYVAYVQKGEARLRAAIDGALASIATSGELEKIDRAYGIWDARQAEILAIGRAARFFGVGPKGAAADAPPAAPAATGAKAGDGSHALGARKRGLDVVRAYGGTLVASAGLTVLLAACSFPLAIVLGLFVALGRLYGPRWLAAPLAAYVEFLRGTPVMLQLYFIFFFLPEIGVNIPALACGIVGLAVNYSAYESEIYRAGLQAVPSGQMEAALALGMSRALALRRIVVPQAVRLVIPPVVNDFIALFKDTSVCSVITLVELTKRFSVLSQSTQATLELMLMTGALYLLMSYPLSLAAQRLERRLGLEARP